MPFKPGQINLPGRRWEPGQSGNPSGRPKAIVAVAELAREYTTEAIEALVEIMRDKKATASARVSAAAQLLDRGHGRAPAEVAIKTDVRDMSRLELAQAMLADIRESPEKLAAITAILDDEGGKPADAAAEVTAAQPLPEHLQVARGARGFRELPQSRAKPRALRNDVGSTPS